MKEILDKVLEKVLSGRFILTCICGLTFAWLSIKGTLTADRAIEIILVVFYGYFTRDRSKENGQPK